MRSKKISVLLWTAQALLAALFLFAGGMKLVLPAAAMRGPIPLPTLFLRFIGVMELLGALGLLLPGLLHIRREFTPLAALGLTIIMTGATVITAESGMIVFALVPFVAGLLAVFVVYGRRGWLQASTWTARRSARHAAAPRTDESIQHAA
ncbi:MAG TPA: DoxX family protein [Gemmatimonadaceae bacterium]|nr:DoxX family protein [Gemmatimonadaceae bacterium]